MEKMLIFLENTYAIGAITAYTPVSIGYLSNNWILNTDTGRYFLKQYRFSDLEKIRMIHRAKFFFSDGGIPVILPILTITGDRIVSIGDRHYALFPFVNERMISREDLTLEAVRSAGEMLAQIHLLSKKTVPTIVDSHMQIAWNKNKFLSEAKKLLDLIKTKRTKNDYDRLAEESLTRKIELVDRNTSEYADFDLKSDHLLHGDYHEKNIFFDRTHDTVTHVFDLEKTGIGPRVLELFRSMYFICFNGEFEEKNYALAKAYVQAYASQYPIVIGEFERGLRTYYLYRIHSLWLENEHYIEKNNRIDDALLGYVQGLRYLDHHADTFINNILLYGA